jgi:hypothetical protein
MQWDEVGGEPKYLVLSWAKNGRQMPYRVFYDRLDAQKHRRDLLRKYMEGGDGMPCGGKGKKGKKKPKK